jgi:hypothetical protein
VSIPLGLDRREDEHLTRDREERNAMTQYMFVLFGDESVYDQMTDEAWQAEMVLHTNFAKAVEAVGATITGGAALLPSSTATTMRRKDDAEPLVTDGPFIETKEALGGFYLVDCKNLDQALELAAKCPSEVIEIRPVMDTSEDSSPPQ